MYDVILRSCTSEWDEDGRGDGPFSGPEKLKALFGELEPEPVELLLAVESMDDEKIDARTKMLRVYTYRFMLFYRKSNVCGFNFF